MKAKETNMPVHPPGRILLATDLSHRTDRALDRSVRLARDWGATLLVVHAIEQEVDDFYDPYPRLDRPLRRSDPAAEVRSRIARDLGDAAETLDIQIHVEEGAPAEIVLRAAEQHAADLIVTGVARAETLGRLWLGSTVDRLARRSRIPLLIVRDRAFAPYPDIVVATDFAPPSRLALETAAAWFPDSRFHLFHGYDVPFASYLGRAEINRQLESLGDEAVRDFLAGAELGRVDPERVQPLIEHGAPAALLRNFATGSRRHLVVVGSHGGGLVYEALIGSTARRIIDSVPGDVLLIPGRQAGEAATA